MFVQYRFFLTLGESILTIHPSEEQEDCAAEEKRGYNRHGSHYPIGVALLFLSCGIPDVKLAGADLLYKGLMEQANTLYSNCTLTRVHFEINAFPIFRCRCVVITLVMLIG